MPGVDLKQAATLLSANPFIAVAEPDYQAHSVLTPNDPRYLYQWALVKIHADQAWDTVTGSSSTVIAVIDFGIDLNHPDLAGQTWINPGEIVGNGIDGDNNGYVDDINGWNFVNSNNDLSDSNGHGTQVAGVIDAKCPGRHANASSYPGYRQHHNQWRPAGSSVARPGNYALNHPA